MKDRLDCGPSGQVGRGGVNSGADGPMNEVYVGGTVAVGFNTLRGA